MTKQLLNIKELLAIRQRFNGASVVDQGIANDTVRLLLGHIELLNDRRFDELMAAKLSGYRDARSEMSHQVSSMVAKIDQAIALGGVV
jgi:hypothetical protein